MTRVDQWCSGYLYFQKYEPASNRFSFIWHFLLFCCDKEEINEYYKNKFYSYDKSICSNYRRAMMDVRVGHKHAGWRPQGCGEPAGSGQLITHPVFMQELSAQIILISCGLERILTICKFRSLETVCNYHKAQQNVLQFIRNLEKII